MASPATHETGALTVNISDSSHTKTSTRTLLSLPREIRDKIFAHLFKAGDLAILRTSKQIYHESRGRLYREGVFRLTVGGSSVRRTLWDTYGDSDFGPSSFIAKWNNFQKFHFRIISRPWRLVYRGVDFWHFNKFSIFDEAHPKRECLITVEYGHCGPMAIRLPRSDMIKRDLPDNIACLTAFEKVVVVLFPDPKKMWGKGTELSEEDEICIENIMADDWKLLKEKVEPKLGPAKFVGGQNGELRRLICRPRDFCRSLARRQQEPESQGRRRMA